MTIFLLTLHLIKKKTKNIQYVPAFGYIIKKSMDTKKNCKSIQKCSSYQSKANSINRNQGIFGGIEQLWSWLLHNLYTRVVPTISSFLNFSYLIFLSELAWTATFFFLLLGRASSLKPDLLLFELICLRL